MTGDQSAGKSAFISEVSGVRCFPSKAGMCTKNPTVVHTQSSKDDKVFTVNGKSVEEEKLEEAVSEASAAKLEGTEAGSVTDEPVTVHAKGDGLVDLVLVDLPGSKYSPLCFDLFNLSSILLRLAPSYS